MLPSWRGGDRAQSSPDWCRCLFASGLVSLLSLHTLALPKKKKKGGDSNINWFLFGERSLVLSVQDLTSYCFEGKLKN